MVVHSRQIALALFLDFSRALETIDRQVLLQKFNTNGIRDKAREW